MTGAAEGPGNAAVVGRATRRRSAEQRRQQILDAAYQLFGEQGYHSTNVSDIAKRLGMSHGTFYRYFESKLDVFQHVVGDVLGRIQRLLAPEDPDAPTTLEEYRSLALRIGDRLYAAFEQDPHLSRLFFVESIGVDAELNRRIRQTFDAAGALGKAYLDNGVRRGFLRSDLDTTKAALAINAMILEAARDAYTTVDRETARREWSRTIVGMIVEGMASREATVE